MKMPASKKRPYSLSSIETTIFFSNFRKIHIWIYKIFDQILKTKLIPSETFIWGPLTRKTVFRDNLRKHLPHDRLKQLLPSSGYEERTRCRMASNK